MFEKQNNYATAVFDLPWSSITSWTVIRLGVKLQTMTSFLQLNDGWNAEPNAPDPKVVVDGQDVVVSFLMNPFQFPQFDSEDVGKLRFVCCQRYRLGSTNDEGWYRGQCRFSKIAPKWGEFYEVGGDLRLAESPSDWVDVGPASVRPRHFLFYFRDETFECDASDWSFDVWRPTLIDSKRA